MTYRCLVTGAKGFSSSALVKLLSQDECEIFLTDLYSDSSLTNYISCDLSQLRDVNKLIEEIQPDCIYHLSGTFSNEYEIDYSANVLCAKNLFDCILTLGKKVRVLLIGSAAEYGEAKNMSKYISENHQLLPVTIYGLTKMFQTNLMIYYSNIHHLDLVMARPFNIIGEGISTKLFVGNVYEQIKKYKENKIKKIVVGNLNSRRDYLHISDVVKDYKIIMEKGLSGDIYNVGSGKAILLINLLIGILNENGLDMSVVKSSDFSSSSVNISAANISKLNQLKTGEKK